MDSQQKVIVVLLVLAILFSAASMLVSFNVFSGFGTQDSPDYAPSENQGNIGLFVEGESSGGSG